MRADQSDSSSPHPLARPGYAAAGLLALLLAGCGGDKGPPPPPPPPPPTVAQIKIEAATDVNPTAPGQGAPIVVRIYQLGATDTFERAEFFPLLHADTTTLGADLIKKQEYLLAPGTTKEETAKVGDKVQAIGIFAAYRDFQTKTWRATVPLPSNKTTPVTVTLGANGVTTPQAH
jgi:type VI secretion system protein VasD